MMSNRKGKHQRTVSVGNGRTRNTPLYRRWYHIKTRCYNPRSDKYAWYGAKGITVCDEWLNDFDAFADWALANGFREDLTIDRIDPDKGYGPENCRWITLSENTQRSRVTERRRAAAMANGAKNIIKANAANMKKVMRMDTGEVFPSCAKAAAAVGGLHQSVSKAATGKLKKHKGISWQYV